MATKNEILRICNDGKVFLHGKLVDKKDVKEVLSTLVNYVPEQELEEELPKKGQVVWGKNVGYEKWYIGHFVKKEFKNYIINNTVDDENTGGSFPIITTKNPYEVEEDREPQVGDMVFAWDVENTNMVHCAELLSIDLDENYPYTLKNGDCFNFCSLKNPLIK